MLAAAPLLVPSGVTKVWEWADWTAIGCVGCGEVLVAAGSGEVTEGVVHAEWIEDPLLNEVLPLHTADSMDHLPGDHVEQVVVVELGAERRLRFEVLKAVDDVMDGEVGAIGNEHQVTNTQAKATAVREEILDVEVLRDVGVVHPKLGYVFSDSVLPGEFAFVDEDREGGGCEGLAV